MNDTHPGRDEVDQATILVVDDDRDRLAGTVRLLEQAGYTILSASSGEQALELAVSHQPELILLDVVLPGISGVEVSQRIKSAPGTNDIFIILVSGLRTSSDDKVSGLDAGADGYIRRPVSNRALLAHMRALLRLRAAEQKIRSEQRERVEQQQREFTALDEYHGDQVTRLTAQMLGVEALALSSGGLFDSLVEQYAAILDLAVEQRSYHVDHHLPRHLLALAQSLGKLSAGPRDVVAIHRKALRSRTEDDSPGKTQVYLEEARYLVLELMGYLAAYYRAYSTLAMRNLRQTGPDQE